MWLFAHSCATCTSAESFLLLLFSLLVSFTFIRATARAAPTCVGMGSGQPPAPSICPHCASPFQQDGLHTALCPSCSNPAPVPDGTRTQAEQQGRIAVETHKAPAQPPERAAPMLAAELESLASIVDALCGHPHVPPTLKTRLCLVLSQLWREASNATATLAIAMQTAPSTREAILRAHNQALRAEVSTLHVEASAHAAAHQETRAKLRACRQRLSKQGWALLHDRARLTSERNHLGRELDGAIQYNETITKMYHKAAKTAHLPASLRPCIGARPVSFGKSANSMASSEAAKAGPCYASPASVARLHTGMSRGASLTGAEDEVAASFRSPVSARGPGVQTRGRSLAMAETSEGALGSDLGHWQHTQRASTDTAGEQMHTDAFGSCGAASGGASGSACGIDAGGDYMVGWGGGRGSSIGVAGVGGATGIGGGCVGPESGCGGGGAGGTLAADPHEERLRGRGRVHSTGPAQQVPARQASPALSGQEDNDGTTIPRTLANIDTEGGISLRLATPAVNLLFPGDFTAPLEAAGFAHSSRPRRATAPLHGSVPAAEGMYAGELGFEKRPLPNNALPPRPLHNPFSPAVPLSFALPLTERPRGRHPGGATVPLTAGLHASWAPEYEKGLAPIASPAAQEGDLGVGTLPSSGSTCRHGCTVTSTTAFMPTLRPQRSPRAGLKAISPRGAIAAGAGFFGT